MITSIDEFEELKKAIDDLKSQAVDNILAVNEAKMAVVNKVAEVAQTFQKGKYIESPERIIISSPDIVIGNVDRWGIAKPGGTVTLRASEINIEGTPSGSIGGNVKIQAPIIHQYASDPGCEGKGESVGYGSEILLHAAGIGLRADNIGTKNVLSKHPSLPVSGWVSISTDEGVAIAKASHNNRAEDEGGMLADLEGQLDEDGIALQTKLTSIAATLKKNSGSLFDSLPPAMQLAAAITEGGADNVKIFKEQEEFNDAVVDLCNDLEDYLKKMFMYKSRQIKFDTNKGQSKYNIEAKDTGNHIVNIITNKAEITTGADEKDSFVSFNSKVLSVVGIKEDSQILLNADNVAISTVKPDKVKDKDGYSMRDNGQINVITKSLNLNSLASTSPTNEDKTVQNEQTDGSKLEVKFKDILIDTAPIAKDDKDKGKGKIAVNTKEFDLTGYECMAEETKKFDAGSMANIAAETIKLGGNKSSKELTTKIIDMNAESGDFVMSNVGTLVSALDGKTVKSQLSISNTSEIFVDAENVLLGRKKEVEIGNNKVKLNTDTDAGSHKFSAGDVQASHWLKGPKTSDK